MNKFSVPFPPADLMFMDKSAGQMLKNGGLLMDVVDRRGFIPSGGLILDIGCGYGRIAYNLLQRGYSGRYLGVDILKRHLEWLQANIPAYSKGEMAFQHLDVYNEHYNPTGSIPATEVRLPEMDPPPELILAFSVFTHMYAAEIEHYLSEISRVMGPKSVLCATFFLLNESSEKGEAEGKSAYPMPHKIDENCRFFDLDKPLQAIGFRESWVLDRFNQAGLELVEGVNLGSWCGRGTQECYQDTVFLRLIQ